MPDPIAFEGTTPRLDLPLLFAGQAQKEFFVNEALLRLDCAVQCAIEDELAVPPAAPGPGQAWLVGPAPSGAFGGHAGEIAVWGESGWRFLEPRAGYLIFDRNAGCFRHFRDSWRMVMAPSAPVGGTVIDSEARGAIATLVEKLTEGGIFAAS